MSYKIYLIFKSKIPAEKGKQDKCKNDKNTKTRHSTKKEKSTVAVLEPPVGRRTDCRA